jgi:hypothetical protein
MLDVLEERAFFLRDAVFLRFGRGFTGAPGSKCNVATREDSAGVTGAGGGDAIKLCVSPLLFIRPREDGAELRDDCSSSFTGGGGAIDPWASPRPSIRPTPKANLNMAPYHLNMESAVSSHSAAGVTIGMRAALAASRGATLRACGLPSRNNS